MSETCELCQGLRGHARLRAALADELKQEWHEAQREYERLKELYENVCWFYFETNCSHWRHPWSESVLDSRLELQTVSIVRDKRGREHGTFPYYYKGTVRNAPRVPPVIVYKELVEARKYMEQCATSMRAPEEWAPGGPKYLELCATTAVGRPS